MLLNLTRTRIAAAVTLIFLLVICLLGILISFAAVEVRVQANELDDARAVQAVSAAIRSFKGRLGSTVRDNAIWDDAYTSIAGAGAAIWAYETWGISTEDYPLYDAAIVLAPDGSVTISYLKGQAFNPSKYFGAAVEHLAEKSAESGQEPVPAFVSTNEGAYLLAAGKIQPFSYASPSPTSSLSTLILAKRLTPHVIAEIEKSYAIEGLRLSTAPAADSLSIPIIDYDGHPIAHLQWPSRLPGDHLYNAVKTYVVGAFALLISAFVAMTVAGAAVVRQLRTEAANARWAATHDALTGLFNRAGLLQAINASSQEVPRPSSLTLGLIDLDGFKEVNDAWGHAVGDELIKLVAERVSQTLGDVAALARLGGDEFAFLASANDIEPISRRLIDVMREPFRIGGRTIEVGASIGTVADCQGDLEGLELLRRADMALYRAKEIGRGCVVAYAQGMDLDRLQRNQLEEEIRDAIKAGDIYPAFQPLVDAKSGRLRGVEALARWQLDGRPISPEVFISVAERAGLIDELGQTILEQAIEQMSAWQEVGVSVNVSPIQLRNPEFAERVERTLTQRGFDPRRLTLEITEGVLMSNPEQAKRAIARLKSIGIRFALDDFGCGYASIGALREFGFDRMKIDRSMVVALDEEKGADVLMATLSLARALEIPVTAEGVETSEQAEKLRASGCDQLQGYLLGRPMQSVEIASLLRAEAS